MRVVVTGVAGFIGSRTAELLLDSGHVVLGIDSVNDAYDPRLKRWRLGRLLNRSGFRFEQVDITDREALTRVFANGGGVDAVINLAARAGVRQSVEDPWTYLATNVTGALNLLELCRRQGIPKLVQASSSSVYGASREVPFREDADTSRPVSPYAASKKAAEVLCHTYYELYGLDVVLYRYFTVYGPAGRPDMSPLRFVQWIAEGRPVVVYGDGRQSRDFTYVDDIVRGTILGLEVDGYHVINLGSNHPLKLSEMIVTLERLLGRSALIDRRPPQPTDVPATWADISRAGDVLGWEPTVPFATGAQRLVDWYLANRDWAASIRTG